MEISVILSRKVQCKAQNEERIIYKGKDDRKNCARQKAPFDFDGVSDLPHFLSNARPFAENACTTIVVKEASRATENTLVMPSIVCARNLCTKYLPTNVIKRYAGVSETSIPASFGGFAEGQDHDIYSNEERNPIDHNTDCLMSSPLFLPPEPYCLGCISFGFTYQIS